MDILMEMWIVTVCSSFYWHFYLQIACCILFLHVTSSPGLLKHRHFTWGPGFPCPVYFTRLDATVACGPPTAQGNKERYKLLFLGPFGAKTIS